MLFGGSTGSPGQGYCILLINVIGFNTEKIIQQFGLLAIGGIVFAESGLLIGFFLPGDTLLLLGGVLASQGQLSLIPLLLVVITAAIVGDNVGYSIGRRTGHRIFRKQDGILFRQEHIERAEAFYEKHGGKTIIIARFIPIVRTFAPIVAGVGKMPRKRFMTFNIIGGLMWGAGITLLGYFVGSRIPHLDKYLNYVVIGVVIASFALSFGHLFKEQETRRLFVSRIKLVVRNFLLNKKV